MEAIYAHGFPPSLSFLDGEMNNEILTKTSRAVVIKHRQISHAHRTRKSVPICKKYVFKLVYVVNTERDETEVQLTRRVSNLDISPKLLETYKFTYRGKIYRLYQHECCHDVRWDVLKKRENCAKIELYMKKILRILMENDIVYLDLKIENIINCNGSIKLIDFEHSYSFFRRLSSQQWTLLLVLQYLLFSLGTYDFCKQTFFRRQICFFLSSREKRMAISEVLSKKENNYLPYDITKKIQVLIKQYCKKTVLACKNVPQFLVLVNKLHKCA